MARLRAACPARPCCWFAAPFRHPAVRLRGNCRGVDRRYRSANANHARGVRASRARVERSADIPALLLAATRLAATPRFAAIGVAGIVASFALMVAMATMVASFRASVDDWLARVLPADLYVRAAPVASGIASSARFSSADLQRMASHPGVVRVESSRNLRLLLDAARP